jgi:PAS domain S-box-containing protein
MTLADGGTPDLSQSSSLEDFFENGTVGLHLVGKDGTILRANRADYEPLGYSAEEYVGRNIAEFHADEETINDILDRLSRGESLDKYHARLKARDGSIRHVLISSNVCFRGDEFINTRCFTIDVTDKLAAEEALRETKERLAATYEGVLAGIAEVDENGRFLHVNEAFCQISGYGRDELLERRFFDLTHPDDLGEERRQYGRQVKGEIDRYATEKRYVRSDGQVIWVEVASSTVREAGGRFGYGIRMVQDITARKEAENRQKLLVDELNHRVKNTLATVQALATQTARRCGSAAEFRARFEPRLLALSAAHDRLTRRNWEGASLREIAREELGAHAAPGRTLTQKGPDVLLSPRASLSLSMALHELATNAVKHGALSVPSGKVELSWEVERDEGPFPCAVRLSWRESGGPPPRADITKGFGSRLLRVTAEELKGSMESDFPPEGYRWSLAFPLPPTRQAA